MRFRATLMRTCSVKNSRPSVRAFDAPGSASRSAFWNSIRTFSSFQISRQVYFWATLMRTCSAGWPITYRSRFTQPVVTRPSSSSQPWYLVPKSRWKSISMSQLVVRSKVITTGTCSSAGAEALETTMVGGASESGLPVASQLICREGYR